MDISVFTPLFDALINLLGGVNGQWAAIAVLVLMLFRSGALAFPFKVPFLTPKTPAAPATPVDPAKPVDPSVPSTPILDALQRWLAERLKARFGELTEAGHSHEDAFVHLSDVIKSDPKDAPKV